MKNVAEEIKDIFVSIFPENATAADAGITEYVGYYNVSEIKLLNSISELITSPFKCVNCIFTWLALPSI